MPRFTRKFSPFLRRPSKGSTTLEYTSLAGCLAVAAVSSVLLAGDEFTRFFSGSIDHAGNVLAGAESQMAGPPAPSMPGGPDYANPCPFEGAADFHYSGVETRLDPNIWNPDAAPDKTRVCVDPGQSRGAPGVGDNWTWEWQVAEAEETVATPKASFGQSPWDGHSETPSLRPIEGDPVILGYDYRLDVGSGDYAVHATTWLSDREASSPSSVTEEITIWMHSAGMTPPGAPTGDPFSIDGADYILWHAPYRRNTGEDATASWAAFSFVAISPDESGDLDITAFHDALADAGLIEGPRWLSSVELGTDVAAGEGDLSLSRLEISGLKGFSGNPPTEPIAPFSFPDTHVAYSAPEFVGSVYLDIEGLTGVPRPFTVHADPERDAVAVSNTMSGKPAAEGELQWGTALRARPPAPGGETIVSLEVDGTTGTWRIIREAPPQAQIEPFSFPDTVLAWNDNRRRVVSDYVEIPGLGDIATSFEVLSTADDDTAMAQSNIEGGGPAASGRMTQGTTLVADAPQAGQTHIVSLSIGGQTGEWRIEREPAPQIGAFDFGETVLAWDDQRSRITSTYVDVPGLDDTPVPFTVDTASGFAALALENTGQDGPAVSGDLVHGTSLEVNPPDAGRSVVVYLTVGDQTGTWTLRRESAPEIGAFDFGELILAWDDPRDLVASAYVDIPGLGEQPVAFELTTSDGSMALARENVVGGKASDSNKLVHGTSLEVATPKPGEEVVVALSLAGQTGTWRVKREAEPQIGAFDYGTTMLEHNAKGSWVLSSYVDIPGLGDTPRAFSVSASNGAEAYAYDNVEGGGHAASGMLTQGTRLVLALPDKGERVLVTLTVDGVSGQWEVIRAQNGSDCVSETGGDCDNGHGNDEDGFDEDNPGNGGNGNNKNK